MYFVLADKHSVTQLSKLVKNLSLFLLSLSLLILLQYNQVKIIKSSLIIIFVSSNLIITFNIQFITFTFTFTFTLSTTDNPDFNPFNFTYNSLVTKSLISRSKKSFTLYFSFFILYSSSTSIPKQIKKYLPTIICFNNKSAPSSNDFIFDADISLFSSLSSFSCLFASCLINGRSNNNIFSCFSSAAAS